MPSVLNAHPLILIVAAIALVLFGGTIVNLVRAGVGMVARIRLHAQATPPTVPGDDYARGYRDGLEAANKAYADGVSR